jgi:hypothetical protein
VKGLVDGAKAQADAAAKALVEATDKALTDTVAEARSAGKVRKGDELFEIAARAIVKEKGIEALRSHVKALPIIAPPDGKADDGKGKDTKPPVRSSLDTIGPVARGTLKAEHLERHQRVLAYAEDQAKAGRKIDYVTALRELGANDRADGAVA